MRAQREWVDGVVNKSMRGEWEWEWDDKEQDMCQSAYDGGSSCN